MTTSSKSAAVWVGIIAILGITMWVGWKALREAKPEDAEAPPAAGRPPNTVIVRPVEEREIVQKLAVTGTLRAVRRAEVAARESAAVAAILIEEGDLVDEGQVIARLDTRRLDAQLEEAAATLTAIKAELTQRQAERERAEQDESMMRGLWEQRAVSEREFLDSVRQMKVATAQENASREAIGASAKRLDLLEVRRADLEVKAPFTGRVVMRHAELGEWLSEGDPVATLVSTGEMEAWLQLPERHVAMLKQASPESVELRVPGNGKSIRADKLALVPDVDGRSRRFLLIAHLPDPDNILTPGSSVEATVPLGTPTPQLVIDADAVLTSHAGTFVFVPEPSADGPPLSKRVPVEVLFESGGESIVAAGELRAGDQVIVEGNERLFPQSPLDPQPWSETRAPDGRTADAR